MKKIRSKEVLRWGKVVMVLPIILPLLIVGYMFILLEEGSKWITDRLDDSIDSGFLYKIGEWVNR